MVGAYKLAEMKRCDLPEDVDKGFHEVFDKWVGASYMPVLYVGEQIVAGINHMIICRETTVTANPEEHLMTVVLNKAPDGKWSKVSIDKIV